MKPRIRVRAGSRVGVVLPYRIKNAPGVAEILASATVAEAAGNVDSIAIVVVYRSGSIDHGYVLNGRPMAMLGAVEELKSLMLDKIKLRG